MSGAGKSLILNSLRLLLGARFSKKYILEGADQCELTGLFHLPKNLIQHESIQDIKDGEFFIRRQFKKDGRSINTLNDRMISSEQLKSLGEQLARILSQDESLGLKDPTFQLKLLDHFAKCEDLLEDYQNSFQSWQEAQLEYQELVSRSKNQQEEEDFRRFQLEELKQLNLKDKEFESLQTDHQRLAHKEEIDQSCRLLSEAALNCSQVFEEQLDSLSKITSESEPLGQLALEGRDLQISIEEWARALQAELHDGDTGPEHLAQIEHRLQQIHSVTNKFKKNAQELIAFRQELESQLDGPPLEIEIRKAGQLCEQREARCHELAQNLHKKRLQASKKLIRKVNASLSQLEMPKEGFNISLSRDQLSSSGYTRVEFMLKASEGQSEQPLHQTASGGEMSRALLSISSAVAGSLNIPLLVFDEIDTSIGSRLGRPIAEALKGISQSHQVLCVTHLAPVAAQGDDHFLVIKNKQGSQAKKLLAEERKREIAQMIAGEKDSPTALKQAQLMLKGQ